MIDGNFLSLFSRVNKHLLFQLLVNRLSSPYEVDPIICSMPSQEKHRSSSKQDYLIKGRHRIMESVIFAVLK